MIGSGMHTDNYRRTDGIFTAAVEPAVNHKLDHVAFGVTHGRYCMQGMGDEPGIARKDHPLAVRKVCEDHHLRISQIDGSFPLMGFDSAVFSGQYVQQSIRCARGPGCPKADTTDCGKVYDKPRDAVFKQTVNHDEACLQWAGDSKTVIHAEPHGPYTGDIECMQKLFSRLESEYVCFGMDSGNIFIQGNDPLEFLKAMRKYITHVHIKDASEGLACVLRKNETGIAKSEAGIGEGVNAGNIKKCIVFLKETDWEGDVSTRCSGLDDTIAYKCCFLKKIVSMRFCSLDIKNMPKK